MTTWLRRHPLASYFILAYAISWSVAVPLALQAHGVLRTHLPWSLHYLMAFGPALAAFAISRLLGEPLAGRSPKARQALSHRTLWWAVGFASPLLMFAASQLVARISGQTPAPWKALGQVSFLPPLGIGIAWALWFATNGCGEETGWRGFLLPRLQQRYSPLVSSALLSIGWGAWHLPAFFYLPGYAAIGLWMLPGFFFGIFAGAIVLTWLYNRSGGSVLTAALWHASFNFVTAPPAVAGTAAAVTSMLVVAWALVLSGLELWRNRRHLPRGLRAAV